MIYDVQRLVKTCLTPLPVACESVSSRLWKTAYRQTSAEGVSLLFV